MASGRRLVGLAVGAVTTGVAWEAVRRRDLAALDADPHRGVLTAIPPGRPTCLPTADGTTLHVRVHTPAQPRACVVFAHGWAMGIRFWGHQMQALAADHQIVAYDQRGHGGSGHVGDDGFTIDALGRDLADVVEAFARPDLPVIVVGHSLGGMSILASARDGRLVDRASGAVLVDTGAGELTSGMFKGLGVLEGVLGGLGARVLRARLPIPHRTTPISSRVVKAISLSPTASPSSVALTEQLFLDAPVDVRASLGITLTDLDLSDALPLWKVPSTVVVGRQDRMTPHHHSERLVRELPDAELVVIERAGHQSPLERPDEVTAAIRHRIDRAVATA
ncbi:MAG: alpha/beta hydrolase [Nitriliruptor sp.]|uniref:alpha/beta fold hydrolase n=1 Tax=Nitriliruptor sp. TaxID=2448056 RepID=UPI0034A022EE